MIAVPGVRDRLPGLFGHGPRLFGGGVGHPRFSFAVLVQRLEVHCPSGRTIVFPNAHHPLAPVRRFGNRFEDSHFDVVVEVLFDFLLPVQGNGSGGESYLDLTVTDPLLDGPNTSVGTQKQVSQKSWPNRMKKKWHEAQKTVI